jgi:hypothetical protein
MASPGGGNPNPNQKFISKDKPRVETRPKNLDRGHQEIYALYA